MHLTKLYPTRRSPRELAELLLFALENSAEEHSGSISTEQLVEILQSEDDMVFDVTQNVIDWLKRNGKIMSSVFMAFDMNALIGLNSGREESAEKARGRVLAARLLLFQAEHWYQTQDGNERTKTEARARALAKLTIEDRQVLGLE